MGFPATPRCESCHAPAYGCDLPGCPHVTPSVTRYEREEKRVTNAESNAAPHHTTPHHTTKNTSSRSVALGRDPELNEWSALARVITALRPDWRWADVRAALLADDRAYAAIARSAILGAGDHDVRHPNGLRYVNPRGDGPSDAERHPSAVTYAERMAELARITADTTGDRS